jgi:hypothetical protein
MQRLPIRYETSAIGMGGKARMAGGLNCYGFIYARVRSLLKRKKFEAPRKGCGPGKDISARY